MISDIITISTEIQSGAPVFSKTRVPIKILFDYLKHGDTVEEFIHDYPSVQREQVMGLLDLMETHFTFTF